ncbi:MAG: SspB family protein [Chakrabartia sp.]
MTDDMPDSLIPYDDIVQEALRAVVGRVLGGIQSNLDLPGPHHFYITFKTFAPGVTIPENLRQRFPDEMTIVLQNKFWDLMVDEMGFEVGLTFGGVPTKLFVPFAAITAFVDPAVEFALHFQVNLEDEAAPLHGQAENDAPRVQPVEDGSNVVTVDFGRKK